MNNDIQSNENEKRLIKQATINTTKIERETFNPLRNN
jgi:hypothetical protein